MLSVDDVGSCSSFGIINEAAGPVYIVTENGVEAIWQVCSCMPNNAVDSSDPRCSRSFRVIAYKCISAVKQRY